MTLNTCSTLTTLPGRELCSNHRSGCGRIGSSISAVSGVQLTGCLLAAPLAATAQRTTKIYRIAIVFTTTPVVEMTEAADPGLRSLVGQLRQFGYVEGSNLVVERRSALGRPEGFREIATDVMRLNPDVILVPSTRLAQALMAATKTIPIVGEVYALVENGLASVLASGCAQKDWIDRTLVTVGVTGCLVTGGTGGPWGNREVQLEQKHEGSKVTGTIRLLPAIPGPRCRLSRAT